MSILKEMLEWEEKDQVGGGPTATKEANRLHYEWALSERYGIWKPNFSAPFPLPVDRNGPSIHPDPWDRSQKKWCNYLFQLRTYVEKWIAPVSTGDWREDVKVVGEALREARKEGRRLRVIGGGQSASTVSQPDDGGHLLQLDGFDFVADPPGLKEGMSSEELAWVGGGLRVIHLTEKLEQRGQAMLNMGGYNGQTVAGALCTGTHGSGIGIPALYGVIASIWLVVMGEGGEPELRIVEPSSGLTAASALGLPRPGDLPLKIIRDDAVFSTVCMGMGWMGVVYAMTLRVAPRYWLHQVRRMESLHSVLPELDAMVHGHRCCELAIAPLPCWQKNGTYDHSCLVTTRDAVPAGHLPFWPGGGVMGLFDHILSHHSVSGTHLLAEVMEDIVGRRNLGAFLHQVLAAMRTEGFASAVPNVLILRYGNHVHVKSCELMVPYKYTRMALERVLAHLREDARKDPHHLPNAPIGLRFVAPTPGPLSPFHWEDGGPTTTLEIPLLLDSVEDGPHDQWANLLYLSLQKTLKEAGIPARFHWGQYHEMNEDSLLEDYGQERVARLKKIRRDFDPTGILGNSLSDRLGI